MFNLFLIFNKNLHIRICKTFNSTAVLKILKYKLQQKFQSVRNNDHEFFVFYNLKITKKCQQLTQPVFEYLNLRLQKPEAFK